MESIENMKEIAMSWQVMTELVKRVAGNVSILWSDMNTGMYDCLCLAIDGHVVISLNRAGKTALVGDEIFVEEIWNFAEISPAGCAEYILQSSGLRLLESVDAERALLIGKVASIGNWYMYHYWKRGRAYIAIDEKLQVANLLKEGVTVGTVDFSKNSESVISVPILKCSDGYGLPSVAAGHQIVAADSEGSEVSNVLVNSANAVKAKRIYSEELLRVKVTPILGMANLQQNPEPHSVDLD